MVGQEYAFQEDHENPQDKCNTYIYVCASNQNNRGVSCKNFFILRVFSEGTTSVNLVAFLLLLSKRQPKIECTLQGCTQFWVHGRCVGYLSIFNIDILFLTYRNNGCHSQIFTDDGLVKLTVKDVWSYFAHDNLSIGCNIYLHKWRLYLYMVSLGRIVTWKINYL